MNPKVEAILKKNPLPWTKHSVEQLGYSYELRDARADRVFDKPIHHHDVDIILALANAHLPEPERYYVLTVNDRFEVHDRSGGCRSEQGRSKHKVDADAQAARLNRECKPDEGAVPERPWHVQEDDYPNPGSNSWIKILAADPDGNVVHHIYRGPRTDKSWENVKANLRHMVAAVNAEAGRVREKARTLTGRLMVDPCTINITTESAWRDLCNELGETE